MKDTTALEVKKPLRWYNRKVKTDFVKLFQALAKAAIMGLAPNPFSAMKEAIGVVDAFELEQDVNGLAYLLILEAMVNASNELIEEHKEQLKQLTGREKLYEEDEFVVFLDQLNAILEGKELSIKKDFFLYPKQIAILDPYCDHFKQILIYLGATEVEAVKITRKLPGSFVNALHQAWSANSSAYDPIVDKLESRFTEAVKREQEWDQYFAFLEKQVEEPVFEESFSLQQIYIPLRAYYTEKRQAKVLPKVAIELEPYLDQWLAQADTQSALKVLSGGPGSGKSTFAKIWAAKLAAERHRLLLITLDLLDDGERDLIGKIGNFIGSSADIKLSYNPLRELHQENELLLIFDGLDKLERSNQEAANNLITQVKKQLDRCNREGQVKLKVLIIGREIVVQGNASKFRGERQILQLLPYFKARKDVEEQFIPQVIEQEDEVKPFEEKYPLFALDQRDEWWKRYGTLTGLNYQGLPPALKDSNLNEITAQPLLNYLVALSLRRGKIQFSKQVHLNVIYQDLIEGVYERACEGMTDTAIESQLEKEEFFRVLEGIALSIWCGDGKTTLEKIGALIDDSELAQLFTRFQEGRQPAITRLLVSFYFREHSPQEGKRTFEFTHQTFGEYLTARYVVKFLKSIAEQRIAKEKNWGSGWDTKKALQKWLAVTGPSPVGKVLFRFLRAEMMSQPKSMVKDLQLQITSLLNNVIKGGMPFGKCRKSNKEENRLSRNAEEALLVTLNLCTKITGQRVKIDFPSPNDFGAWVSRLQPQRKEWENTIAYQCFSNFILVNAIMLGIDLHDAKLEKAYFFRGDLQGANLSKADLRGAILKEIGLQRTNLRYAELEGADLGGLDLQYADLEGANLENANLSRADLRGANLKGAELPPANLQKAKLQKADLRGARLGGAELQEAKLQESNLGGADLHGARLEGANLEGATLDGAILEGALGLSFHQLKHVRSLKGAIGLPEGLKAQLYDFDKNLFE
ncbi:MAG: pentapeptide repeat-containing protein [Bacteroidota bacterium]